MNEEIEFALKPKKRAMRRHHKRRLFKKYRKMLSAPHYYWGDHYEVTDVHVKKVQDNFSICSCSMCRNERRNPWNKAKERLTLQERKAWNANDFPLTFEEELDIHDLNDLSKIQNWWNEYNETES